mmetsp:Transcript_24115/g.47900  ORF Transcript_24115/g.47900 Transcript_24115/m.47900 type:complete len:201 (+) Transcript_24115:370-972(+)
MERQHEEVPHTLRRRLGGAAWERRGLSALGWLRSQECPAPTRQGDHAGPGISVLRLSGEDRREGHHRAHLLRPCPPTRRGLRPHGARAPQRGPARGDGHRSRRGGRRVQAGFREPLVRGDRQWDRAEPLPALFRSGVRGPPGARAGQFHRPTEQRQAPLPGRGGGTPVLRTGGRTLRRPPKTAGAAGGRGRCAGERRTQA